MVHHVITQSFGSFSTTRPSTHGARKLKGLLCHCSQPSCRPSPVRYVTVQDRHMALTNVIASKRSRFRPRPPSRPDEGASQGVRHCRVPAPASAAPTPVPREGTDMPITPSETGAVVGGVCTRQDLHCAAVVDRNRTRHRPRGLLDDPRRLGPVNTIGRFVISLLDGAHRDAVRTHRALPPATAWQCQHAQFAGAQRDPVRRRAGVQVARVAEALWELAHDLHPYESLVQERGARPGLRTPATRPVDPYQAGGGVAGQHRRQGPSRRHGGSKKNGPQAIGSPAAGGPPRFIWLPRMLERH